MPKELQIAKGQEVGKLEAQHWAEPVSLTFHSVLILFWGNLIQNLPQPIGASHEISVRFGKAVSEKIFRKRPI